VPREGCDPVESHTSRREVLLVDRFQQHGHRSLDNLILERGLPNRTLTSIVLLNPDTLDGGCLIAAAA